MQERVVIVGAGQAGLQVAISLRGSGFRGEVTLVGDEVHLPYMRPPLSKGLLLRTTRAEDLPFRNAAFFEEHDITLERGRRVVAIERATHEVVLDDGRRAAYNHLVLATGARLRRLACPGAGLDGVAGLRTLDDAIWLAERFAARLKLVVVGGGFIGLEVAAAASKQGCEVTVIEALDRLMARAVSPQVSGHFLAMHHRHGIDVRLGCALQGIEGMRGRVSGVRLVNGSAIACEMVLVGIGVLPNTELADDAGLPTNDGIIVDRLLRSPADPDVFAIGDCARFSAPYADGLVRLESVQNAVDQAKWVASAIVSHAAGAKLEPFACVPWFWTEQFETRLQMVGWSARFDQARIVGDAASGSFSIEYERAGRLVAVDSLNRPAEHLAARKKLARLLTQSI